MTVLKACPLCDGVASWESGAIICRCGVSFRPGPVFDFDTVESKWNQRPNIEEAQNTSTNTDITKCAECLKKGFPTINSALRNI